MTRQEKSLPKQIPSSSSSSFFVAQFQTSFDENRINPTQWADLILNEKLLFFYLSPGRETAIPAQTKLDLARKLGN